MHVEADANGLSSETGHGIKLTTAKHVHMSLAACGQCSIFLQACQSQQAAALFAAAGIEFTY